MPLPRLAMRHNAMPLPRLAMRRNTMPLRYVANPCHCNSMRRYAIAKPIFASRCYAFAVQRRAKPLPPRRTTKPSISFALLYATLPCRRQAMVCRAFAERSEASRRNAFAIQSNALPLQYEASPCLAVAMLPQQCFAVAYLGNAIRCRCHAGPGISLPLRRTAAQCLCNQPRIS